MDSGCPSLTETIEPYYMEIRNYISQFKDEGQVIAGFGQARLIKFHDGKYELRGGSREDRIEAHEWISIFCHEIVVGKAVEHP
jgi:hypothetical protein